MGLVLMASSARATEPASSPETQRGGEFNWDYCRNAWLEGKEDLNEYEKFAYVRDIVATRELTAKQKDCILKVGDRLLDHRFDDPERKAAADWLGTMGHVYCIPPLLAVLRDSEETSELRARCVICLSRIADKRIVEPLIDAMTDDDKNVACHAWMQLNMALFADGKEAPPAYGNGDYNFDLEWRKERQRLYRQWWEKNRDRATVSRAGMGGPF